MLKDTNAPNELGCCGRVIERDVDVGKLTYCVRVDVVE